MNEFCKNCKNRSIPISIKKKFNDTYKKNNIDKTFIECPTSDPKIVGCLIKERLKINWNGFCIWLNDTKNLTTDEAMVMVELGLLKVKKTRKAKKGK